jgi:4-hydroxy-tetrahydrodipicolinate synthase
MAELRDFLSKPRVIPPLVTPLCPDGEVDRPSLERLLAHVLGADVDGVLMLGSTGEGGHLSDEARELVVGVSAQRCGGRAIVMAGVQSLNTAAACVSGRRLVEAGADVLLVPAPLSLDLTQSELAAHFGAVANAVSVPVVAYNVPARTPSSPSPQTIADLAATGVLAGVKDSSGDLANQREVARATRGCAGFGLFTGSETCIDMALLVGFTGAIPGLANVWPERHVALTAAAVAGDWASAREIQDGIAELAGLYALPSAHGWSSGAIGALKEALVQGGVIESSTLTAPFTPPGPQLCREVKEFLAVSPPVGRP